MLYNTLVHKYFTMIDLSQLSPEVYKTWKVYFDDGRIMEFHSIRKWCLENNYDPSLVTKVCKGKYKKHKDIVKVEVL